mmetsp:Transcript_29173/g.28038  ORF Transcript_29173/g.28038 Transcript_29173/m.28038 type:complete len:111 (+) Transcript_29173:109-441(+)
MNSHSFSQYMFQYLVDLVLLLLVFFATGSMSDTVVALSTRLSMIFLCCFTFPITESGTFSAGPMLLVLRLGETDAVEPRLRLPGVDNNDPVLLRGLFLLFETEEATLKSS